MGKVQKEQIIPPCTLTNKGTKTKRGEMICLRLHSYPEAESEPESSCPLHQPNALSNVVERTLFVKTMKLEILEQTYDIYLHHPSI